MQATAAIKAKQGQYETTIKDFVQRDEGYFFALSDDLPFLSLLRLTLSKELALANSLTSFMEAPQFVRAVRERAKGNPSLILFIERIMSGKDMTYLIRQFKEAYPTLKVVVLTNDLEKDRLMLLHELGADNCVTKPVSTNTLIEKLAFTIKPMGRLGELIDRAKALVVAGDTQTALKVGQEILDIKPNSAAGFLVIGDAHRHAGNLEKARDAYEKASEYAELFMEPLRRLEEIHAEMGDHEGRLHYLRRLDALSPLNVDRKVDMGELHLELGHDGEAEQLFDDAVGQATKDALSQISLITNRIATVYSERDPEKAERYLRRSIQAKGRKLGQEDVNTFNLLGITLRRQGRWKDALQEYQKALQIAPNDENIHYNMGMACGEGAEYVQAKKHMSKALEINPDLPFASPTIAYNIGIVFMYAGGKEQALRCLRLAVELDPGMTEAEEALARIASY